MNTYYIPTSSLNFNNIFSSESISPAAFYAERGFGYSWFTTIPENPYNNILLLYAKPKQFARPLSDMEDHPMLLEISTDEQFNELPEGVFYSDHTIYLNPWDTKIHFFTEHDKIVAFSLSESSLETKTLPLYKNNIDVKQYDNYYQPLAEPTLSNININHQSIELDRRINRIKGLLYGYYIGANLSTSRDSVHQLHILYEIRDIISSIMSNPKRQASEYQKDYLQSLLEDLNKQHPLYHVLLRHLDNDENKVLKFIKDIISMRYDDVELPFYTHEEIVRRLSDETTDNPVVLNEFNKKIKRNQIDSQKQHKPLSTLNSEIVTDSLNIVKVSYISEEELSLLKAWTEHIITSQYGSNVGSYALELATQLTYVAKDTLADKWETSNIRDYMNALRHHLNGEAFTQQWDNGLLSSLAAVLLRGDDWERFLLYMQYREMYDYRLAFAFYGLFHGFANLTRDFTDNLLNQDELYVKDVYKEFKFRKLLNSHLKIRNYTNKTK